MDLAACFFTLFSTSFPLAGISHAPEEWTDYDKLQKGIEVVLETVKEWTEESANESENKTSSFK